MSKFAPGIALKYSTRLKVINLYKYSSSLFIMENNTIKLYDIAPFLEIIPTKIL
jgi:hypothetical protein